MWEEEERIYGTPGVLNNYPYTRANPDFTIKPNISGEFCLAPLVNSSNKNPRELFIHTI